MGILGALGAGVADAAEYGAKGMYDQMRAEIEQQKQEALLMMREQVDIRAEDRKRQDPLYKEQLRGSALENDGRGQTIEMNRAKIDRDAKYGDQEAQLRIDSQKAQIANSGQSSRLNSLQLEEARIKLDRLKEEVKVPAAVTAQAASLRKRIEVAEKSMLDAEAKNELTPEGRTSLTNQILNLSKQASDLTDPYMPKTERKPTDAERIFGPVKTPESAPAKPGLVNSAPAETSSGMTKGQYSTAIREAQSQLDGIKPGGFMPIPAKAAAQIKQLEQKIKALEKAREGAPAGA